MYQGDQACAFISFSILVTSAVLMTLICCVATTTIITTTTTTTTICDHLGYSLMWTRYSILTIHVVLMSLGISK